MRKQEVSSVSCECAHPQLVCTLSEWTNTQRDKRTDTLSCSHQMSNPPLALITFSFLAVSRRQRRKGKKRSSFPGLLREATECYLISLVSVLNSCLPFLPCMSLISCIRPSQFFLTELNLAESLIGITEHVQCLIHNAWPQPSFII